MPSVLLVEDEFLIRAVVIDALEEFSIACIEAPSGQKAIDIIDSSEPLSVVIENESATIRRNGMGRRARLSRTCAVARLN